MLIDFLVMERILGIDQNGILLIHLLMRLVLDVLTSFLVVGQQKIISTLVGISHKLGAVVVEVRMNEQSVPAEPLLGIVLQAAVQEV